MENEEKIALALNQINHDDDSQWLPDGTPSTKAVQRIAGDTTITAAQIAAFVEKMNFRRVTDPLDLGDAIQAEAEADPVEDQRRVSADTRPAVAADTDPAEPVEVEAPMTVKEAQTALAESHLALNHANDKLRQANAAVALALTRWQQATRQIVTPEMLKREYLASEQAERAARVANGGVRPGSLPPRLGSAIDAVAFYGRNAGRTAGGGRSFARGGFPPSARGQINRNPARGPVGQGE